MSGGHFDYECFKIQHFADQLRCEIDNNEKEGDFGYFYGFSEETISLLNVAQQMIDNAAKLAYQIEWLYSGDIGEEQLVERISKVMAGLDAS